MPRQRANLLSQELGAMGPPSQRQVVALGRQRLAVQRLEERQKKLQQQTRLCVLNCTGREFLRKTMREQLPV
ncbi:TP901 family phage tail tape measure protein [Escherichia coli]|nr:TP901 family phage tail tape measure protein [Escherichia coli]